MTDDQIELPAGIGPHEGRELELMLSGEKPLAMFYDIVPATIELPEAEFEPFVASGRIVKRTALYVDHKMGITHRYLFYALPGEEWRIEEMQAFKEAMFSASYRHDPSVDRRAGWLLGYDDRDVDVYMARSLKFRRST